MSDYPQWRGPKRSGLAQEAGLLKTWPEGGPKLLWQSKSIGDGYGSVSVVGNRLYLVGNEGMSNEFVHALDARSGRTLWKTRLGVVGNPDQQPSFPGARTTPTVEGNRLYALGSDGDLACLDATTGRVVWSKSLRKDFDGKPGIWAYSESPLVHGDKVIVTPGGPESAIVALNKKTGETVWKSPVPGGEKGASYASAIVVGDQVVQHLSKGLFGVSVKDGTPLWVFEGTIDRTYSMHAHTPVAIPGGLVYSASGTRGATCRPPAGTTGPSQTLPPVWEAKGPSGLGGTVLVGRFLYGTNQNDLVCVDTVSGKVVWSNRSVGAASICAADGLLFVHGEGGEVALVEASFQGYNQKGRFNPPSRPEHNSGPMQRSWSHPAVANGRLYLRDGSTLWVYAVKAGA
jgi:outer membrane protein assembly factor BamB